MLEVTKGNYWRLKSILSNPQFIVDPSATPMGAIFQVGRPNTISHLCLEEKGYGASTFSYQEMPLVHKGKYVVLADKYASDLFFYQYTMYLSSEEDDYFANKIHNEHNIKLSTLAKLRSEGLATMEKIRNKKRCLTDGEADTRKSEG